MAYGDGTFYKRGNVWRYTKVYESKTDGKSYRLSVSAPKKSDCREAMKEKEAEKEKEIKRTFRHSLENRTVVFEDALKDWIKREKFGKVKASTYDRLERTINNHIAGSDVARVCAIDITSKDVNKLIDGVYADHSLSTVKKLYELLDQFFRFFYANDLNSNPMNKVGKPRPKKNVGEIDLEDSPDEELKDVVLNDEEIGRFKAAAMKPYVNGSRGATKHGPDLYFIMMTVLRFGEATAVTWGDIDLEKRKMLINKNQSVVKNRDTGAESRTKRIFTTPKNGKAREVMISSEALEALLEIKKRSHHTNKKDLVICSDSGKSLTNANLRKALDSVMKSAELSRQGFGLHYLRHTGISYYLRHGIPLEMVSKMAGHSSVAITERVYYHIIHQQDEEMLKMMDAIKNA
jgi:integrase